MPDKISDVVVANQFQISLKKILNISRPFEQFQIITKWVSDNRLLRVEFNVIEEAGQAEHILP